MEFARRIVCVSVAVFIVLPIFSSCSLEINASAAAPFECFTQIPGVTPEQIHTIENLLNGFDYFIYGMTENAEAFYSAAKGGQLAGFTVHFTDWLTGLFGIPFKPAIFELPDIYAGLEDGSIHFTGQLTRLPERERFLHMTTPIVSRPASFSAQNEALFPIVEVVQLALDHGGMTTLGAFYSRGMVDFNRHRLIQMLTPEELNFIAENPVIPISARSAAYPASFFNDHIGQFQGIAHDILREIETLLDIRFETVHTEPLSRDEIRSKLRTGETLLAAGVVRPLPEDDPFLRTADFLSDNYALLSRCDFPGIGMGEVMYYRIGVFAAGEYRRVFESRFGDHMDTVFFTNSDEIFDALLGGEIDLAFSTRGGYLAAVNYHERSGLRINALFDETYGVGFAVNPGSEALLSIIDKAMTIIDVDFITNYWLTRTFDDTMRRMEAELALQRQRTFTIVISALLVSIMLAIIIIKTSSEKRRLAKLIAERTQSLEIEAVTLNAIFDTMPDIIFCKDLNSRHTRVNQRFLDLFHVTREDVIGKNEHDFMKIPADIINGFRSWDARVINERIMYTMEDIVPTQDGGKEIFETIKVPMVVDDKVVGILGIARDITRRKELEEEIINASKAKTTFIANMSHEIRTPMNSIVGFSELALEEEISDKARSYLTHIIDSSRWLLQIINDILDISKIESGKLELENEPFRLSDIFESCKSLIHAKALEKGLKLHFYAEPCSDNKLLVGDAFRLSQIFTNLLTNAVKFTGTGIVRVTSTIKESTDTTRTIHCEIQDTGIGMSAEQITRVTEPFMQGDVSITRKYGGTGLGLPIVTKLIAMMGGELKIESRLGEGSKFSFELTFETVDSPEKERTNSPLKNTGRPDFTGEVLVCEDNFMNQMVITEHLQRVGLEVTVAENGFTCVDKVKTRMEEGRPFDLILMDIHMPVMDGIDAAGKIINMGCKTPIIALTANIMATDREAYRQYGMGECIGKPFTSQELWRSLLKYLKPVGWTENTPDDEEQARDEDERQLIRRLKESFVREHQGKFEELTRLLDEGKTVNAYRYVHTLKSSAGLVGRQKLQKAAAGVENILRGPGATVPPDKLARLEVELTAAITDFLPLMEEPKAKNKITDAAQVRELLAKLEPLIKKRSPDSLELIAELSAVPGAEELTRQIEAYDFKPALQTLNKLKEIWRSR